MNRILLVVILWLSSASADSIVLENTIDSIPLDQFVDLKSLTLINSTYAQYLGDDALDAMPNLQNLTIVASNMSEVRKWSRGNANSLQRIDLHGNSIWQIQFAAFAPYKQLVEVNLAQNRLVRLNNETFFGANQLQTIDLSGNALEQIDEFTFNELLRLKSLNLRQNKIQYFDVFALTTNTRLEHLDVSDNRLKSVDATLLYNALHLKCLNLSGNALRFVAANTFAENTELIELDLSRNRIIDLHDLAFVGLQRLEFLNLKRNQLSDLTTSLLVDLKALKCLDLSSNLMSTLADSQFSSLTSLTMLHIASNIIHTASNHTFRNLSQLECVDLSQNRLNDDQFLHELQSLKMLNLSFNRFETINATLLHDIEYVELVGNYWRCSWLIPELVNRRLAAGIHFVANSTSRKSVYDEIDCYADNADGALPKHHRLRHIVVLRDYDQTRECTPNERVEQSVTINIYRRAFSDNFTFTNSLIWVAVGMIILMILIHWGKFWKSDWTPLATGEVRRM